MYRFFKKRGMVKVNKDIAPDEIFLDSENLPGFNTYQFEGRIEKPISQITVTIVGTIFLLIVLLFVSRIWNLQIIHGEKHAIQSEKNSLRQSIIFADRGIIYDIHRTPLAWNETRTEKEDFSRRKYIDKSGFSNLLGYVSYPQIDEFGFYFIDEIEGIEGVELVYNDMLGGDNGSKIVETNALDEVISQSTTKKPDHGIDLYLTIDADVQESFRDSIAKVIIENNYQGGGGIILDIFTGEILSLVSFPEYDSNVLSTGEDNEKIASFVSDEQNPFLNRVVNGLYTPGSIIKPFVALAALDMDVISPYKEIVSTGSITVPNPYDPDNPSVFNDWKIHGSVNMREAIANSSNVYFYEIGGGFEDQKGLGIDNIYRYLSLFGFGKSINSKEFHSESGVIPNPEWKERVFDDIWRVGDTYYTAIGQYGFQVTPLQVASAYAALANNGTLIEPHLILDSTASANVRKQFDIAEEDFRVVKEGMRNTVLIGTAKSLNYPDFEVAVKTGTAELGIAKSRVNSWLAGFFPYSNPRYSFAVVLESGVGDSTEGALTATRLFLNWLRINKSEYTE